MATKWKNGKSILGFLSFVLGVSLLLSSLLPLLGNLTSESGRQGIQNALKSEFQETRSFRTYLSNMMNSFIAMGAGGPIYGTYYGYSEPEIETIIEAEAVSGDLSENVWYASDGYSYFDGQPTENDKARWKREAEAWNKILQEDKNLLYFIECDGKMLYSNTGNSFQVPVAGYSFLLTFDGTKCTATQNGTPMDLYGDGIFREDGEHWELPGYTNFQAGEEAAKVRVKIAVADTPTVYIKSNYTSAWAERQYNRYFQLERIWQETRRSLLINGSVTAAAGLLFLLIWFLLRKYKSLVDRAIARFTGKIWFELKLLLLLGAVIFVFLPLTEEMHYLIQEVTYATNLEEAVYYQYPWFLESYLREILQQPRALLLAFWGGWLFFNDLRYGDKPWQHGTYGMLTAKNLQLPIQKRISRRFGLLGLCLMLLGGELIFFLILQTLRLSLPLWMIWNLFLIPVLLVFGFYLWEIHRQKRLAIDLGLLIDQITAVHNGDFTPAPLPSDSDLGKASQEVTDIQLGMAKAVEEQTKSERMKVELVTNVSHDIKTPLTSIISYVELLKKEQLEPPAGEYVDILSQKTERLRAMVLDVFDISKAASGNLPVKLEPLDLDKLLRQTLADMAEAIDAAPVTLRQTLTDQPVMIIADGQRLYRVFQNLLQNALKYALEGSRVYLTLSLEENKAVVSLKNISKAELSEGVDFTERFVRGDASRTDGGSGLGLAIADSFTRACGGELKVEPIADLFVVTVTFPIVKNNDAAFPLDPENH